MPEERLQKILSRAGIASRRKAEQLILEGRVTLNGTIVTELGSKADLDRDHVRVDGKLLHSPKRPVYIALNKPNNCVTTVSDPQGRQTVMDLLARVKERVYPVGRLDYHSEGLLLLTNDGELANALMSATTHLPKSYLVKVNGALTTEQEQAFREGISLEGRRTAPAGLKLSHRAANPWYEVRLFEGRKNQIRLMFRHFGRLVEKLKRVKIGPLDLGALKPGEFRYLSQDDVERLRKAAKRRGAPGFLPARIPEVLKPRRRERLGHSSMPKISELLRSSHTIAVVGLSSKRYRPSFGVAEYMQNAGYQIIPVNPFETEVLGETAYATLDDVPEHIDIVDIFRRSEFVPDLVETAIRIGASAIWMQEGVVHEAAAAKARAAGLEVVMDRCILKEHRRMLVSSNF